MDFPRTRRAMSCMCTCVVPAQRYPAPITTPGTACASVACRLMSKQDLICIHVYTLPHLLGNGQVLPTHDFEHQTVHVTCVKRVFQAHHFVQAAAEAPHVTLEVIRLAAHNLWGPGEVSPQ